MGKHRMRVLGIGPRTLLYQLPALSPTSLVCVEYHELDGGLLVPDLMQYESIDSFPSIAIPQIGKSIY